jgi:hypothetical protein
MSTSEHTHPGEESAKPVRKPLSFEIPAAVIDRLAGGRRGLLRRLTTVKAGPPRESLDPVVQRALESIEADVRTYKTENEAWLADNYLDDTEAVTASLNRRALPALTRALLGAEGVYELLLVQAFRRLDGDAPEPPATHHH